MPGDSDFNLAEMPDFPPTDETGDVDLSQVEYCLSLTPAQRIEQNYHFRLFAEKLRQAGERYYGSPFPDPQEIEGPQR
jgi:hypothetical protein